MEKNILTFPVKKAKRVMRMQKQQAQKAVLSLSLLSIVFAVVFANEHILKANRTERIIAGGDSNFVGRNVASAGNLDPMRDIEWEHSLAKRLAKNGLRGPASVAQKASPMDELKYGFFEGQYQFLSAKPNVTSIQFSGSIGAQPKVVGAIPTFLTEHKSELGLSYKSIRKVASQDVFKETYELLNEQGRVGSKVEVSLDAQNGLLSMHIDKGL